MEEAGLFLEVTPECMAGDVWDGGVWRRPRGKVTKKQTTQ